MKGLKVLAGFLTIFLTTPIWYYLLYKVLESVKATELMWFLFWIYMPASFFIHFVTKITMDSDKK